MMRAVEFHGNGVFELVERPEPVPGPGELLLAPLLVGVCGTDVEIYDGRMAYYRQGIARYPIVPGHEWVAEVVAVGAGVADFEQGDRVVGECSVGCSDCVECRSGRYHLCARRTETGILNRDGAMGTRMVFPARSAFAVPAALPVSAAALVEPASVALNATRRVSVSDRMVLVVGAGPIGLLVAQCARAEGAAAIIVGEPAEGRRAAASSLGLDTVLPFTGRLADDVASVRGVAGAAGPDVVFICAAAPTALALAVEAVRPAGAIVVVALFGRPELTLDIDRVVVRDVTLHGILGSPNCWPDTIDLLRSGEVVTGPLVGSPLPLTAVSEAMALVREGSSSTPKILIDPQREL